MPKYNEVIPEKPAFQLSESKENEILDIKFTGDGQSVCTSSSDSYIKFFEVSSGMARWTTYIGAVVNVMDFSSGLAVGIACDLKNNINLLSMMPNPVRSSISTSRGHSDTINCCKIGRLSN
jgi:WD40 repeat protein